MPNVLSPDLLLTDIQQAEGIQEKDPEGFLRILKYHPQIFEFKPVDKAIYLKTRNSAPIAHIWFRIKDKVQIDLPLQQQILAFASDYNLLLSATLPHREKLINAKVYYASLDHALWFHRDFIIDDWLLYSIESPSASNARGFSRGSIFDKNGIMVASVTQEGLMRKFK